MKYKTLSVGNKIQHGDQVYTGNQWCDVNLMIGVRLSHRHTLKYRRPIPEKKVDSVDWKRVAARMNGALNKTGTKDAQRLYAAALRREKKGEK